MRVIFLDFDGVLHPLGLMLEAGRVINGKPVAKAIKVDFFCWLPLLMELVDAHPDVVFVAHTSWRESHSLERLQAYFGEHGGWLVDATRDDLGKLASIKSWLEFNQHVEHWCILDDAEQEFEVRPAQEDEGEPAVYADGFIACHYERGIAEERVQRALQKWLLDTAPSPRAR